MSATTYVTRQEFVCTRTAGRSDRNRRADVQSEDNIFRRRINTMIEISHLTKRYGALTAVDDISFRSRRARCSASSAPTAPASPPP